MIGLPTSGDLEDVVRAMPAPRDFGRELREAAAHDARHLLRAPGFIIAYETRLIRSSPKRICGFIAPAEATTSPLTRSQRCAAIVVEPMSKASPKASRGNPARPR